MRFQLVATLACLFVRGAHGQVFSTPAFLGQFSPAGQTCLASSETSRIFDIIAVPCTNSTTDVHASLYSVAFQADPSACGWAETNQAGYIATTNASAVLAALQASAQFADYCICDHVAVFELSTNTFAVSFSSNTTGCGDYCVGQVYEGTSDYSCSGTRPVSLHAISSTAAAATMSKASSGLSSYGSATATSATSASSSSSTHSSATRSGPPLWHVLASSLATLVGLAGAAGVGTLFD